MGGLDLLSSPVFAKELQQSGKRCILLWLAGGASQLETFDPKPGRPTGGPYRAIQTTTPGLAISELMPKMADRVGKYSAIIRSLDTKNADHGGGARLMIWPSRRANREISLTGRRAGPRTGPDREPGARLRQLLHSHRRPRGLPLASPDFSARATTPCSSRGRCQFVRRLEEIADLDHQQRGELRRLLSESFARGRQSGPLASHNESYSRVRGLMASEQLFDISRESQAARDKYGPTLFAEQCLVARRLVEAGVPFVKALRLRLVG